MVGVYFLCKGVWGTSLELQFGMMHSARCRYVHHPNPIGFVIEPLDLVSLILK